MLTKARYRDQSLKPVMKWPRISAVVCFIFGWLHSFFFGINIPANRIDLAQERDRWRDRVKAGMNLAVP
jgi:hypothetical protein